MDDFATVIWVVIIAGAMIFNVVSQSRKARGKGARTPGHEEAWPSQAHPESEPDPMPAPRPAPWPVAPVFPDECQSLEEIPAIYSSSLYVVASVFLHVSNQWREKCNMRKV